MPTRTRLSGQPTAALVTLQLTVRRGPSRDGAGSDRRSAVSCTGVPAAAGPGSGDPAAGSGGPRAAGAAGAAGDPDSPGRVGAYPPAAATEVEGPDAADR